MQKKCENCKYFSSKGNIFAGYYCSNPENVEERGIFNRERVYRDVRRESSCDLFTPKTKTNFKY